MLSWRERHERYITDELGNPGALVRQQIEEQKFEGFGNTFSNGGQMKSFGYGIGFNAKAGVEIPINDRLSFDTEYKFSYGKLNVNNFRSLSDIDVNYRAHSINAGVRVKF